MESSMYRLQGMGGAWVSSWIHLFSFSQVYMFSPYYYYLFFFLSTDNLFCNKIFLKKKPYLFKLRMWNLMVKTGGLCTKLFETVLIVRKPVGV